MVFVIDCLEILRDKLRIDLRGGNIAVAEQFLNGAQIRAVLQQVRCEAVAQCVRRDILVDVRLFLLEFDDLPEALTRHALAGDVDEQ